MSNQDLKIRSTPHFTDKKTPRDCLQWLRLTSGYQKRQYIYKIISPFHLTFKNYVIILSLVFEGVELSVPQYFKFKLDEKISSLIKLSPRRDPEISCHKFKSKCLATEKIYTMPILVFQVPVNYLSNGREHSLGKLNVVDNLKTHSVLF